MRSSRTRIFGIFLICLVMVIGTVSSAEAGKKAPVLPAQAKVHGLTLGEWHAEFYHAMYAIPLAQHPAAGFPWTSCYLDRVGNVGLGVAYFGTGSSQCDLPVGVMLYVPIVGVECSTVEAPPFYGGTLDELTACASQFSIQNLSATVDGIPVESINQYIAVSPLYQLDLPDGNILGVPAGSYDSVANSSGFIIHPLSRGQHVVHVYGEVTLGGGGYNYDWTYYITVKK